MRSNHTVTETTQANNSTVGSDALSEQNITDDYYVHYKIISQNETKDNYTIMINSNKSLLEIFEDLNKVVNKNDKKKNKRDAMLSISALALGIAGGSIIMTKIACNNVSGLIAGILLINCAALVLALTYANRVDKEDKKKQNFKNFSKTLTSMVGSIDRAIEMIENNKNKDANRIKLYNDNHQEYIDTLKGQKKQIDTIIKSLNNSISSNKELNQNEIIKITDLQKTIEELKDSIQSMKQSCIIQIDKKEYEESVKKINAAKEAQKTQIQVKTHKQNSTVQIT